ncbi:MAG: hypothetical protein R2715_24780 [Ilumatobacteraceae bacterium]
MRAEAPYIGTGIERRAARDAADLIQAIDAGEVTEVSESDSITVRPYETAGRKVYRLAKFRRARTRTPASTRFLGSKKARSWSRAT